MKYLEDINEFEIKIKRVEKLILLGRFFKNKKLILSALEEQAEAGKLILISVLKHQHMKGLIELTNDPEKNMNLLKSHVSKKWKLELEIAHIIELMELNKKHKKSPIEFMRKKKVIILDENQNIETITIERLRSYATSISTIKSKFRNEIDKNL